MNHTDLYLDRTNDFGAFEHLLRRALPDSVVAIRSGGAN